MALRNITHGASQRERSPLARHAAARTHACMHALGEQFRVMKSLVVDSDRSGWRSGLFCPAENSSQHEKFTWART
jgi:hypothetical protein